jgi:hypothetical protein
VIQPLGNFLPAAAWWTEWVRESRVVGSRPEFLLRLGIPSNDFLDRAVVLLNELVSLGCEI